MDLSAQGANLPTQQGKKPFSVMLAEKVSSIMKGKVKDDFVTNTVALLNQKPELYECDHMSIVTVALQAHSLGLSLNPVMGQGYPIPYKQKGKNGAPDRNILTFQIGYKGYLQLAMRSGQYKKINVLAIKEGELDFFDPLNEEIHVSLIQDDVERENAPTIGYYAMFEYVNGFRKCLYWSKSKMAAHADRYSPAFSLHGKGGKFPKVSFADFEAGNFNERDSWLYSSFWYKDFDGMAYKTMLRQLISKWGIMSVEMQKAYDLDTKTMVDNDPYDDDIVDVHLAQPKVEIEQQTPPPQEDKKPTKAQVKKMWLDLGFTLEDAQQFVGENYEFWKATHVEKLLAEIDLIKSSAQISEAMEGGENVE